MGVSPVLVVFTFKGRSYIQGESVNGEGTLDLLLCKFSILAESNPYPSHHFLSQMSTLY